MSKNISKNNSTTTMSSKNNSKGARTATASKAGFQRKTTVTIASLCVTQICRAIFACVTKAGL